MGTLTKYDVARIIRQLDRIRQLTDQMRDPTMKAQEILPTWTLIYAAAGAVDEIRDLILAASLSDMAVEPKEGTDA